MSHGVNVSEKSDRQLADLQTDIMQEQALRRRLDASPEKIEHAIAEYQKATGKGYGEPWEHPTNALAAYRRDAEVTHKGHTWFSLIPQNTGEPGRSGWRIEPEFDPETGKEIPPPYVRPAGVHDSFEKGYRITWEDGLIYETTRNGVDWDPGNAPEDWILVEEEAEPDPPEDEEPVEPEEPEPGEGDGDEDEDPESDEPDAEPGTIDNPHTWEADVDYKADHYVTYDGAIYRIRQDHKSAAHWTPDTVAALYKRQNQ